MVCLQTSSAFRVCSKRGRATSTPGFRSSRTRAWHCTRCAGRRRWDTSPPGEMRRVRPKGPGTTNIFKNSPNFGACCPDVGTLTCCQRVGFPLSHQKLIFSSAGEQKATERSFCLHDGYAKYFLGLRPLAGYASLKLYHVMSFFCSRNPEG